MEDDRQLLREFVRKDEQAAFEKIVERHRDWLYSVCLRRLGDSALAEDAVQAVFLALARRAPALVNQQTLSPWLHRAARFCASNLIRARKRRERHESEAASMNARNNSSAADSSWNDIEADLEPALDRLRPSDREAILLRFYEQKDHAQIAEMLGISQEASQKRLSRAIERLRQLLVPVAKSDVNLSAAMFGEILAKNVVGTAPPSLVKSLGTLCTSTPPHRLAGLAKSIAYRMALVNVKAIAIGVIVFCLIASGTGWIIRRDLASPQLPPPALAAAPPVPVTAATAPTPSPQISDNGTSLPWKFPNSQFVHNLAGQSEWTADLDAAVKRTPGSDPAAHLHSTSSPDHIAYLQHDALPADRVRGKHVVVSAWIKTKGVSASTVFNVQIGSGTKTFTMNQWGADRVAHGDTDWQLCSIGLDVPTDATEINLLLYFSGPGDVWVDGFQIDDLWSAIPVTDNPQQWRFWGAAGKYSALLDPAVSKGGHPSLCVSSSSANPGDWIGFDHDEQSFQKFQGHKIQIRAWMKLENVSGAAGIAVGVRGAGAQTIARVDVPTNDTPHGTADWKEYVVTIPVASNATSMQWGFKLLGRGKIWVDLDDAQCELADGEHGL